MKKKYIIYTATVLISACILLFFTYSIPSNKYLANLPNVTISSSNNETIACISFSSFNRTIGTNVHKDIPDTKYLVSVTPESTINLKFDDSPGEHSLSLFYDNKYLPINSSNYNFSAPKEKGIYKYKLNARWYGKGLISYLFNVEVK